MVKEILFITKSIENADTEGKVLACGKLIINFTRNLRPRDKRILEDLEARLLERRLILESGLIKDSIGDEFEED
jgi:hypothetical protein